MSTLNHPLLRGVYRILRSKLIFILWPSNPTINVFNSIPLWFDIVSYSEGRESKRWRSTIVEYDQAAWCPISLQGRSGGQRSLSRDALKRTRRKCFSKNQSHQQTRCVKFIDASQSECQVMSWTSIHKESPLLRIECLRYKFEDEAKQSAIRPHRSWMRVILYLLGGNSRRRRLNPSRCWFNFTSDLKMKSEGPVKLCVFETFLELQRFPLRATGGTWGTLTLKGEPQQKFIPNVTAIEPLVILMREEVARHRVLEIHGRWRTRVLLSP